jgi:hypothetical protein
MPVPVVDQEIDQKEGLNCGLERLEMAAIQMDDGADTKRIHELQTCVGCCVSCA